MKYSLFLLGVFLGFFGFLFCGAMLSSGKVDYCYLQQAELSGWTELRGHVPFAHDKVLAFVQDPNLAVSIANDRQCELKR